MPNYVANLLTLKCKDPERIKKFCSRLPHLEEAPEELGFDFNEYVSCPEELKPENVPECSSGDYAIRFIKQWKAEHPHERYHKEDLEKANLSRADIKLGRKYMHNIKKYGYKTWYDWNIDNWGTKWNACNPLVTVALDYTEVTISFDTAWSAPIPVIRKIAQMFPDFSGTFNWADEDFGYNSGYAFINQGEISGDYYEGGSEEAIQNYFLTHPGDEEYYRKDKNGEWHWYEDIDDEEELEEKED